MLTLFLFLSDKPSPMEGYPMRSWSIEVYLLDAQGNQIPASIFDKVTYKLHPSFEKRAIQGTRTINKRFQT